MRPNRGIVYFEGPPAHCLRESAMLPVVEVDGAGIRATWGRRTRFTGIR